MCLMAVTACLASVWQSDDANQRVHQHLTARQPGAICQCGGEELCTHLPLVIIDTGGVEIRVRSPRSETLWARRSIPWPKTGGI